MFPSLLQFLDNATLDAAHAFFAALVRVALGWKAEPRVHLFASFLNRFTVLVGSIALAVTAGLVARWFAYTREMAPMITLAVAFNAQHVFIRLSRYSDRYLEKLEKDLLKKQKERRKKTRCCNDDKL